MALCFVVAQLDCDGFILHLTNGRLMDVRFCDIATSPFGHEAVLLQGGANVRLPAVDSMDRCNTSIKSISRGFIVQGFSWSFIELSCYLV